MTLDEAIRHCYEVAEVHTKYNSYGGFESWNEVNCTECAKEHLQLANWLRELKHLREQTRWIPVSERLPENYQRVLVTVVNYDGDKVVRVAVYYDLKKIFKINENMENWKVGEEGLLAWMPLPLSYQGE